MPADALIPLEAAPAPKQKSKRRRSTRKPRATWSLKIFTAQWCAPWPILDKQLRALEEETPSFKIERIDVDDEPVEAERHRIIVLPTILVLRNGEERQRLLGAWNAEDLKKHLKRR